MKRVIESSIPRSMDDKTRPTGTRDTAAVDQVLSLSDDDLRAAVSKFLAVAGLPASTASGKQFSQDSPLSEREHFYKTLLCIQCILLAGAETGTSQWCCHGR